MPNQIDASGLQTATRAELLATYTAALEVIYGVDINLDSDSPDGQEINIFIQAVLDLEDILQQTNNQFDPDNAVGVILDQRVAINGIQRQAGTFSVTPITLVISQSTTLFGLDQTDVAVYTVADNAGTQWQLQTTQNFASPGTFVVNFQAANPGQVLSQANTITVPVTIVLGVASVNNPSPQTIEGINEETDAALKIRRQQSVSLASQGYLAGLLAALKNINGMVSAFVFENLSSSTNGDGVPGHSIWVIVSGTASASDIAQAIYTKRNAGCGMFGATSFTITQVDGSSFNVFWDTVVSEPLFIKFTATSLDGVNAPNIAAIVSNLPTIFKPGVNQEVNINELATLVQQIDPNTLVTNAGFSVSSGGTYTNTLSTAAKNNQFVVSSPDVIVLPMILSPATSTVLHGTTRQFTGLGGFGTLTYSIFVNNSGGSINTSSGLYTAGATPSTDTVKVVDSIGNSATAIVTVT